MRKIDSERSDLNPGICRDLGQDLIREEYGDDLLTLGTLSALVNFKLEFGKRLLARSANTAACSEGYERRGHFL